MRQKLDFEISDAFFYFRKICPCKFFAPAVSFMCVALWGKSYSIYVCYGKLKTRCKEKSLTDEI